ncbi:hypothetical protein M409DRAFT_20639 [Zasmidium cellare ATCC 36951]|uniref:Uncharacterized protein n=1 Tax=Zasmidium cellare ATCC 36951 TaxID=1080233 RepID=A0A6A6CTD3_ZASCE|nr:uncharacterized protein M409DRAFT_20639 [Zasmidium cellare ATCC 36951]KAF2169420.1 hypothetical protein M409DRAFT_20639 [Zasmidium cellare ATCC 36951]
MDRPMSDLWDSPTAEEEQRVHDHEGLNGSGYSRKRFAAAEDQPPKSVKSPRTEVTYQPLEEHVGRHEDVSRPHSSSKKYSEAPTPDSEVLIDVADESTYEQYQSVMSGVATAPSQLEDSRSTVPDPYDFSALLRDNARLQAENSELRERASATDGPLPYPVLYRIKCVEDDTVYTFRDSPIIIEDGTYNHQHVQSLRRVPNEIAWEESQIDVPFVVYKSYACGKHVARLKGPVPKASHEEVHVLDEKLQHTLQSLFKSNTGLEIYHNSGVFANNRLAEPHVWMDHFENDIGAFLRSCAQDRALPLRQLLNYLESQSLDMRRKAADHFAQGLVTSDLMPYLFKPNDLLLGIRAPREMRFGNFKGLRWYLTGNFTAKNWTSGRKFLEGPNPLRGSTVLRRFHWCRSQQYVTCATSHGETERELAEVRYMVDVKAYYMLHGDEKVEDEEVEASRAEDEDFILRLPPMIQGFRMSDKCWVNLRVDDIKPVVWNKQAFKDLVIADDDDGDTKQLIRALVQNKIQSDEGIDFVDGKGNGLVLLLHGAPEKPLYRVTCGDVGTSPVQVEEYLESVFTLGRRWGCVVLLDEADVFLEERSLDNLERNALVSVFLRAVEYYDGILILTSNRVGQFDEAFKSRVQLALPYRPLTVAQRIAIWTNFIHKLQSVKEAMHFDDIFLQIEMLAKTEMNGRQIRNAINTARQLARFQGNPLSLKDLKRAINVSQKFDRYIDEIRDGQTEEEIARQKGDR